MTFTVAIDGPAASGKGTIGRSLAAEFGFQHLDTGLLYRAVGALVSEGADPVEAARALHASDVDRDDLRGEGAGSAASKVAAIPEVRAALLEFQRRFAQTPGGAVLDGRDIGTIVCPDAQVKLFVTASDLIRAGRRWREEGGERGASTFEEVLAGVRARDERDRARTTSPLKPAADAILLDTSGLRIADAVSQAVEIVRDRLN